MEMRAQGEGVVETKTIGTRDDEWKSCRKGLCEFNWHITDIKSISRRLRRRHAKEKVLSLPTESFVD